MKRDCFNCEEHSDACQPQAGSNPKDLTQPLSYDTCLPQAGMKGEGGTAI
jgi:hypothetical protein